MSAEAHKRKYDEINSDNNIVDTNDDNPSELKRQKLGPIEPLHEDLDAFRALPMEMRCHIFSYLNWRDAMRSQVVCSLWYQEALRAIEVLNLRAPELTDLRKTSWLLRKCTNVRSFTQYEGRSQAFDLQPMKQLQHLRVLHLHECEPAAVNIMQLITKHVTGLVALTCPVNIDDIEFRNLCKEFSQRHLTKLAVQSMHLTNSGLHHISLLTELKDFSLNNSFSIHAALSSVTTNLRRLKLISCERINRFDVGATFPNLESLVVKRNDEFKLENLNLCTNLTRLKSRFKFGGGVSVAKLTQLQSLELSREAPTPTIILFQHLTKLHLIDPTEPTGFLVTLARLKQLKSLRIDTDREIGIPGLFCTLPNLESLSIIGATLRHEVPADISALQHLTFLKIECQNCSVHLNWPGHERNHCNEIQGIEKLTNLEVLHLKICTHPILSNLTRLRSLWFRVNCYSQDLPATAFIDQIAQVPKLALEEFQISGVPSSTIQSSITHLISKKPSLQELVLGVTSKHTSANYYTSKLMGIKKLMQRYAETEGRDKEIEREWSDDRVLNFVEDENGNYFD